MTNRKKPASKALAITVHHFLRSDKTLSTSSLNEVQASMQLEPPKQSPTTTALKCLVVRLTCPIVDLA
tara:strand:+ start:181 stop:384 length:204 start_codon:yes stop_codon:yes gene_type:complete